METKNSVYIYLLIGITGALLFFFGLGQRDFWGTPEARTAEIAREMLTSGDWTIPHLNGVPRLTKPPLYFWCVALLAQAVNNGVVTEPIARFPAALCAVLTLLLIVAMGKMLYNTRTGFYAALICATMFSFFAYARYAMLDMMLVFFETAMIFFFIRGITGQSTRKRNSYLLMYLCAAGALYTKGPVGILIPFMGILTYLGVTHQWRELRAMHLLPGITGAVLCILPWVMSVYQSVPDVWGVISHETVNRVLNPYDHIRSVLHFVGQTPFCMMPWTLCIPLIVWDMVKNRRMKEYFLPLSFFVPAFVFFSLCLSKQSHYLLPLYPFMALAVSRALQNFAVYAQQRSAESRLYRIACPTPFKAGIVSAGIFVGIAVYMAMVPWLNSRESVAPFCEQLNRIILPTDRVITYDFGKTYVAFYLRRAIPDILTEEELEKYLTEHSAYIIMKDKDWQKLGHSGGKIVLRYENKKHKIVVIKKGSSHARFIT